MKDLRVVMSMFDKETGILEYFSDVDNCEILVPFETTDVVSLLAMLKNYKSDFVDNSSHSSSPPDFYSYDGKFAFEMFRVNDCEGVDGETGKRYNHVLSRERKVEREIRSLGFRRYAHLLLNVCPDEDYDTLHTYKRYVTQHERVSSEHVHTMLTYKSGGHKDCKVGCFVFDESDVYVECADAVEASKPFDGTFSVRQYHHPCFDFRFMKSYVGSGLDFFVWFSPYKRLPNTRFENMPVAYAIDLTTLDWRNFVYKYSYNVSCMRTF